MISKKLWLGSSITLTALLLSGCHHPQSPNATSTTAGSPSKIIATVNGKQISQAQYDAYKAERSLTISNTTPDRKALIAELIDTELLEQAAITAGIEKLPNVKARIKQNTSDILIQALLKQKFGKQQFTNAEMQKTYKALTAQSGGTEYKARHILVKTKAAAEKIIAQLNKGANFASLAKKDSTAPSAPQGGELGWFTAGTMVPPFAAAVEKLKKGEYTKAPVHTQFGWHVILLQDTRKLNVPSFKELKPRIKLILTQQAIEKYVSGLRAKAKIQINAGKPNTGKPATVNPPAIKETTGEVPTT